jgi:hypothetical protein
LLGLAHWAQVWVALGWALESSIPGLALPGTVFRELPPLDPRLLELQMARWSLVRLGTAWRIPKSKAKRPETTVS